MIGKNVTDCALQILRVHRKTNKHLHLLHATRMKNIINICGGRWKWDCDLLAGRLNGHWLV